MTNYINHNNYKISYSKWNIEKNSKYTLLFVHASGFHGMIWNQIITKLPDYNCIAIDLSGHGLSDNPDHDYEWNKFAFELETLIVDLNLNNIIGIGHSLGGYAITHATNKLSNKFAGLILFDPSVFTKNKYEQNLKRKKDFIHPISKRRNLWDSFDEMYKNFSSRLPFKLWDKQVLKDYCEFGLNKDENENIFKLSCPPWAEARMMSGSSQYGIFEIINKFKQKVLVIRAGGKTSNDNKDLFSSSVTDPKLSEMFSNGEDLLINDVTHFIPQEKPEECAKIIYDFIR
mgnify:FL=1